MMFERFTGDARTVVVRAQEHARRLGHSFIGCEHLLLAVASTGEAASAALREHGVTPQAVERQIARLVGLGPSAELFGPADRVALASIGIDLDAVRERIEAAFGPGAFSCAVQENRWRHRPAWRQSPMALLRRSRRCRARGAATAPHGSPGTPPAGHIPFTPRAKKSLENSLREARALGDNHIGVQHLTLALAAMHAGAVPPILSALGVSQAALRTAILDRYRQAS